MAFFLSDILYFFLVCETIGDGFETKKVFTFTMQVLPEEPNKNYFSLLWVLPKIMIAIWELNRGFMIPYIMGKDYKESWCLRIWRVFGLVVPGVAAHSPQDYVNSTRLGSLPSDL